MKAEFERERDSKISCVKSEKLFKADIYVCIHDLLTRSGSGTRGRCLTVKKIVVEM